MSRVMDKKMRKVLEMRTDSPAMLTSLDAISDFFGDTEGGNTLQARRSLREDLEKQNYHLSACFLKSFERLKVRLDGLQNHVNELEASCQSIAVRLHAADNRMLQFTEQARAMRCHRDDLVDKAGQVSVFLDSFQLTPAEVAALQGTLEEDNGRSFFSALQRLKEVRKDCGALVTSEHQSAGFELLDALSRHQEAAYERLYQWVQDRRQHLEQESADADATLQVAMKALQDRPLFFAHCQESIVGMRKKLVLQRFVVALTQGGLSVRPIEIQAHDPVRYVGDMLAWVHQTLAMERELLRGLFGHDRAKATADSEEEEPVAAPAVGEVHIMSVDEMLSKIMHGIARPLKARLSMVVEDTRDVVVAYRLLNYLAFYGHTIGQLITPDSALAVGLLECRTQARETFHATLKQQADRLVGSPPMYSTDLSALQATTEAMKRMQEIMQVHSTSLMPREEPEWDVGPVLGALVEPLLTACRLAGEGLDASDTAVHMLNNAGAIHAALLPWEGAAEWADKLLQETDTWLDVLVHHQADKMLERCGLARVLHAAGLVSQGDVAAQQPLLDPPSVSSAMRQFYSSLFSLVMPDFERLQSPKIKLQARQRTAVLIASAHETMYNLVSKEGSGYEDHSFLLHTPEQVRMLLDCE